MKTPRKALVEYVVDVFGLSDYEVSMMSTYELYQWVVDGSNGLEFEAYTGYKLQ